VTSLSAGPEEAGQRAEQATRSLMFGLTKHRKGVGAIQSQADYLQSIGVKEGMTFEERMGRLHADLAAPREEGRDLEVYLGEQGFRSTEEIRALIEIDQNYDAFKARVAKARDAQDGAAVARANAEAQRSRMGQEALAKNRQVAATALTGEKYRDFATAVKQEEAEQTARGYDYDVATNIGDRIRALTSLSLDPEVGRQKRFRETALDKLRYQARELGVEGEARKSLGGFLMFPSDAEEGAAYAEAIRRKGGQPSDAAGASRVEALLEEQNRLMRENNALLQRQQGRAPGRPAAPIPEVPAAARRE
jgi:hypothetical protein